MSEKPKDDDEKTVIFDPNEKTVKVSADYFSIEPTIVDPARPETGAGPASPAGSAAANASAAAKTIATPKKPAAANEPKRAISPKPPAASTTLPVGFRLFPVCALQDDDELIAAVTSHRRTRLRQHLSDFHEHGIANLMPVCIVCDLEAINIHHRDRIVGHLSRVDDLPKAVRDRGVIECPGQLVATRALSFRIQREFQLASLFFEP